MIFWLLIIASFFTQNQDSKAIEGFWYAEPLKSYIFIQAIGEHSWEGVIKESETPDYIGKVLLKISNFDVETNKYSGTLILPKTGMHISSTLELEDEETLRVIGKVLFITKTVDWKRINSLELTNDK